MAPASPRTNSSHSFSSSQLIRRLADLDIVVGVPSKQTFAERLSPWLDWTDAIALSAALNTGHAATASTDSPAAAGHAVADACQRVRTDLAQAIVAGAAALAASAATAGQVDAASCRRHHLGQQRGMDNRIAPLRADVRAALSRVSPRLARLAALDAVLDKALAARERQLLATVPGLLDKHLQRLQQAHLDAAPEAAPAPWLATYCKDLQAILLAELEIRLQPIDGMLEALQHAAPARP